MAGPHRRPTEVVAGWIAGTKDDLNPVRRMGFGGNSIGHEQYRRLGGKEHAAVAGGNHGGWLYHASRVTPRQPRDAGGRGIVAITSSFLHISELHLITIGENRAKLFVYKDLRQSKSLVNLG